MLHITINASVDLIPLARLLFLLQRIKLLYLVPRLGHAIVTPLLSS
jgi:hypothetical protein